MNETYNNEKINEEIEKLKLRIENLEKERMDSYSAYEAREKEEKRRCCYSPDDVYHN